MTSEKKDAWCLQIVWGESERRWKKHRRETTWNNYSSHLPSWKNSFPAAWPKRKLVNPTRIVCQIWGLTGWRPVNPFKYCRSAVICIYIRIIYIYISLCVWIWQGRSKRDLFGMFEFGPFEIVPLLSQSRDKQWQAMTNSSRILRFSSFQSHLNPEPYTEKPHFEVFRICNLGQFVKETSL